MLALVIVAISGWFLASVIGAWAYFSGKPEENFVPFANLKPDTYQFLREQRQAKLKSQPGFRVSGQVNTVY